MTLKYTEFFTWGSDQYGQLGLAETYDQSEEELSLHQQLCHQAPRSLSFDTLIKQIACGDHHTVFITQEGQLFSMGRNNVGQLGVGDAMMKFSGSPLLVSGISGTPSIVKCGSNHTVCLTSSGRLFTWGQGAIAHGSQQTSIGPQEPQFEITQTPVITSISCGKNSTAFVTNRGQIFVTGENNHNQFGKLPSFLKEFRILQFSGVAQDVECGLSHLLVLTKESGKVFAMGDGSKGNLGQGFTYPSDDLLQIHQLQKHHIVRIQAGRHSSALDSDGNLFFWGPVFSQEPDFLEPVQCKIGCLTRDIFIGERISAVVDVSGRIYTWGIENNKGQLGGNHYYPTVLQGLSDRMATQVACGLEFCVGLGQDCDIGVQTTQSVGIENYIHSKKDHLQSDRRLRQTLSETKQILTQSVGDSKLHERIAQLTEQNRYLTNQNHTLIQKLQELQEDKDYLINLCQAEIQKLGENIDHFIESEQVARGQNLREAEAKIKRERSLNKELGDTIFKLRQQLNSYDCRFTQPRQSEQVPNRNIVLKALTQKSESLENPAYYLSSAKLRDLSSERQPWPNLYFENKTLVKSESGIIQTEPTTPREFISKSQDIAQKLFRGDKTLQQVQATMDSMVKYQQLLDQKLTGYEQKLEKSFSN